MILRKPAMLNRPSLVTACFSTSMAAVDCSRLEQAMEALRRYGCISNSRSLWSATMSVVSVVVDDDLLMLSLQG